MKPSPRVARRKVLAALGAAAAGVSTGCTLRPRTTAPSAAAPLADLVGPVGEWRVEQVLPLVGGAVPVLMRTPEGKRFQVDLMRAEVDGPRAVAQAGEVALYLANGGAGDRPSAAVEEQGARALAQRLTQLAAERGAPAIPGLLTLSERLASHRQAVLTPWS
ncbi:hypothetical protein SAMN02745121_00561 [Nannocystis exedens]|uniref:Tat (Twin-arginine translocation) pathway signal sequence n=1 Tax=Nannocystis exedens TaxID=54 RepID=A0A1I1THH7_9BACT|nr:hypothetical protein [Nannocystis exedens]PCC66709.1 hypothetical protein NAEX_09302 [Nannocystis exedens]SFD55030.1 hypothetical protein SAMN02745121_00561 [Nannocystis exedens]